MQAGLQGDSTSAWIMNVAHLRPNVRVNVGRSLHVPCRDFGVRLHLARLAVMCPVSGGAAVRQSKMYTGVVKAPTRVQRP